MAWETLHQIIKNAKKDETLARNEEESECLIDGTSFRVNPRTGQRACDFGHFPGSN